MEVFVNPNIAYFLVLAAMMLFLLTFHEPKFTFPKVVMVLCFLAAGYEFLHLKVNPWAFLLVALSPLPFFIAGYQDRLHRSLFLVTIFMLLVGCMLLFVEENNHPAVNYGLAGIVSALCGSALWITVERRRSAQGVKLNENPDSAVGLIGELRTDIEVHGTSLVLVEGELWQASSKEPIRAGSQVRVLRQDGYLLTVKKMERLTKESK